MKTYDAIFVGTGHNALVAAAYLARAGWGVLMLEKNDRPGGFVRTEELTLPGFKHDTFSTAHPLFVGGPAYAELRGELEERGLRYASAEYPTGVSLADGRTAVLSRDVDQNAAEAERLAAGDGAAYLAMFEEFGAYAETIFTLFGMDLASPQARQLIRGLMLTPDGRPSSFAADFLRTGRDVLEERFRSEAMHALSASWLAHIGRPHDEAGSGPWVPLSLDMQEGYVTPIGGSEMLARALARLIEDSGGEILTDSPVTEILVRGGAAAAVRTEADEVFEASRAVVACTAPDQLYLKLLAGAADAVPPVVRRQAERFRYGLGCVQIHLALSQPPRFADERLNRAGAPQLTTGIHGISRATNEAIRGLLPTEPTISFDAPSNIDPSRAPQGQAVARLQMLEVPTRPRGDAAGKIEVGDAGWTDEVKERFADRVIEIAARHIPNLPASVLGRAVIGPREIAAFNPNSGPGDPYGGRHDLAQSYLFRPLPAAPSHATPVPNLYMLGAATWPGHGVSGGSGRIVAQRLLAHPPKPLQLRVATTG